MPASSRGFFAAGPIELFAVEAQQTIKQFKTIKNEIAYLSDQGSGYLSKGLAAGLVGHIKEAIDTAGSSIGKSYPGHSEAYKTALRKLGRSPEFFKGPDAVLYNRIHVLNRRYSGGRGAVAGIDDRGTVPRIGWSGENGRVKVSTYLGAITFGSEVNIPRPVIPDAIENYVAGIAPKAANHFFSKKVDGWEKYMSQGAKERQSFGGSLPSVATGSLGPNDVGSYVTGADLSGMSVGSSSVGKQSFKKDNELMYQSLIESGMSVKAALDMIKEMEKVSG